MSDTPLSQAASRKKTSQKNRGCPICAKPVTLTTFRPFCSRGCKSIDLNRWLSGAYVVPEEVPEDRPADDLLGQE